ncbi:hypothetical protein B0F88_105108 [Methylobacter tundripaludum]|uniref:Uncharacterized protein n=1 Tax=Methylobacter tundripaludum TaxID=173365 RepID=A0A2S6H3L6_9GAMM|nr:hypothetical protein B0F88_105108 [Methylobacter tundripaludum]
MLEYKFSALFNGPECRFRLLCKQSLHSKIPENVSSVT